MMGRMRTGLGTKNKSIQNFRDTGRIILALDSVLWVVKMLEYLSIHPKFGPYIYSAGKMV